MARQGKEKINEENIAYPFAVVLRLRVVQVVCGIATLIMGSVALIEEKAAFNLGLGMPAGMTTVFAAAHNIYSSRGFDGYHAYTGTTSASWIKWQIFGSTYRLAATNILLWALAIGFQIALCFKTIHIVMTGDDARTVTASALAHTELFLSMIVAASLIAVTWIGIFYDPDWQEPPDLAHSNTCTAVSMVTISQSAPV